MDAVKGPGGDVDSADERLEARVAAADRGEVPPAIQSAPQPAPAAAPAADPWRDAARYFGGVVRAMLPDRIKAHWTDERLTELGAALARCAAHYHWDFNPLHPLSQLGGAAFPLLWPIAQPYVEPYLKLITPKPAANEPAAGHAPAAGEASSMPSAAAAVAEAGAVDAGPHTVFPPRDQRVPPLESEPVH